MRYLEEITPFMLPVTPGEIAEILKIVENGPEASYPIGKMDWTTKHIDLDPFQGQIFDRMRYLEEITPLYASGDPPVKKLKFWKLLKMVQRRLIQLEKSIKPQNSSI